MPYHGYLCLGFTEIVNDCRTIQRVADGAGPPGIQCRACDPCCPDVSAGLGFPDGYNPTETPWYVDPDPAYPIDGGPDHVDSLNFAGLLITSIEGLGAGDFTRPVTESAGYGAVIGQGRQAAPTVVITALLMAATCCAQDFGFRWLRNALRGSCSAATSCAGDDLLFLSCEPQTPDLDCLPDPDAFDYEAWLAPYYRSLKGAALIDGPHITDRIARGCPECDDCPIYQVQFTIAASKPCMYRDPVTLAAREVFDCAFDTDCIEWDPLSSCDGDDCPTVTDCATDPDCSPTALPPTVPAIVNPCDVDCITDDQCRICLDIPAGTFPSTGEGTLVITVDNTSGKLPIRRLKLQVWQNPTALDPDDLDACVVCSELNISYLAPGAALTIDGANMTSTITCPGGSDVRANPFISSSTGSPSFSYPVIDGCAGLHTMCLTASGPIDPAAFISVQAVGREC